MCVRVLSEDIRCNQGPFSVLTVEGFHCKDKTIMEFTFPKGISTLVRWYLYIEIGLCASVKSWLQFFPSNFPYVCCLSVCDCFLKMLCHAYNTLWQHYSVYISLCQFFSKNYPDCIWACACFAITFTWAFWGDAFRVVFIWLKKWNSC